MRSGEYHRSGEGDGRARGTAARPDEQLGLYGDRDAGMEPEVLVESFTEAGRQQDGSGKTNCTEDASFANGLFNVSSGADIYTDSNNQTGAAVDLSTVAMDTLDGTDFPVA